MGKGFGLVRRHGGQCAADGQYAEEFAADHVVRVSRARGLSGLARNAFSACGSYGRQKDVQLVKADLEGGGQTTSLWWLRTDPAALPATDRCAVHTE
ncbi:hypothetical protein GCM10010504_11200 [Streptomyces griseus]|nr:hypothetical protein GCM10010504_11200 [Streptomyces griseus]